MIFLAKKLRLPYLFIILLLAIPGFAFAGSVHGIIKSGDATITGASVRLLELDRATASGAHGEYSFERVPSGTYHVFVHAIGYASMTSTIQVTDGAAELSFSLTASAIPGEDVVVSASPYARTANDQYQSAATKDAIALHQSPGSSFAEEIEDLPGVSVRWNGSAPARPMLRGLTDNDVLITENGLRTGDLSTFDPAHAVPIEAEGVEEVDVVRGPASVMFGPNAVGGVVNVITSLVPEASDKTVSGHASVMGNTVNDLYSGYFNTVWSDGSSALKIAAGGVHSQDISIPSGFYMDNGPDPAQGYQLDKIPQSFIHTYEESIGYSYTGGFGMIGVGVKHYQMNYGIPGDPLDTFFVKNDDGSVTSMVDPLFSRIQMENYGVELKGLFNVGGSFINQIKLNANAVDYNHSEHPIGPNNDSLGNPDGTFSEFEQNNFHQNTYNTSLQFIEQRMGDWQGTLGIWTNLENLNIGGLQPLGPNSVTTDLAGYIYEEYIASENTRFQGALRYDYNNISTFAAPNSTVPAFVNFNQTRNSSALTGSLGVVQKLSHELTGSLSIGRSFRAPTLQELFGSGPDDASASFIEGDSSLVSETGIEFDASLKGNMNGFTFEVSPFFNIINNYLYSYFTNELDTVSGYYHRKFAQANAQLFGFEASTTVQLMEHWSATASASYVNASIVNDSTTPLPFIPPLKGLLRLNYLDQTYSGAIEWRLTAAQNRLGPGGGPGQLETPTAGYGVVNIGFGVRLPSGNAVHFISVHCDNVLDQSYRDNLSVIKDFLPMPARGFRLVYDVTF